MYLWQGECIDWHPPIVVQLWEQLGELEANNKLVHASHPSDSLHHWFAYLISSQTELIGIIFTNKLRYRYNIHIENHMNTWIKSNQPISQQSRAKIQQYY